MQIRNNGGGAAALFIRGVGSTAENALAVPANAFSIDAIFLSRPIGPDTVFYDLERVEVLKGPQGTLYGRNATGGAFNVVSAKPKRELGANLTLEVGSYWLKHVTGAVNVPLGEKLAVRVAGNWLDRDGYYKDGYADSSTYAGRAHLLWEPSSKVSLLASVDYAHQGGRGPGGVPRGPDLSTGNPTFPRPGLQDRPGDLPTEWVGNDPWLGPCSPEVRAYEQRRYDAIATTPAAVAGIRARWSGGRCDGHVSNDLYGGSLDLEVDLGFATWSTIAGYRSTKQDTLFYLTAESQKVDAKVNQFSVESRLTSNGEGRLRWLLGLFALNEAQNYLATFESFPSEPLSLGSVMMRPVGPAVLNWPNVTDLTAAVFTQETFSFTEHFRATAGLRATYERKRNSDGALNVYQFDSLDPANTSTSLTLFSSAVSAGDQTFNAINYRAGLEYDLAARSLLYVSASSGSHAGGLNPGADVGPNSPSYKQEELTAFAFGSKNRLLDGLLQLNAEAFYWLYRDLQVVHFGNINSGSPDNPSVAGLRTDNAGRAHVMGVDIDADYLFTDNDLIALSALLSDSEYDSFVYDEVLGPFVNRVDLTGNRLGAVPLLTATLGYQHTFQLGDLGTLTAGLRSRFQSGVWMFQIHTPGDYQKSYTISDLTLTYDSPNSRLSVTAYVRNIEGSATLQQGGFESQGTGTPFVMLNPPRTLGLIVNGKL